MDILVMPPGATIFDHVDASQPCDRALFFVDSGWVSLTMHLPHAPNAGQSDERLSYRLKKVSKGSRGVGSIPRPLAR